MPFPPTFTNVWDITTPADTQLANLLGQDIRNLKNDTMQRMSLLSGTLANRPTPETVNATWGGTGFGLLYFSTDSGQIFQWSGSGWTDISGSFFGSASSVRRFSDVTSYSYTSGTNTTTGITVPAGVIVSGSHIQIICCGKSFSNTVNFRLIINGGTIVLSNPPSGDDFLFQAEFIFGVSPNQGYGNFFVTGSLLGSTALAANNFASPGANTIQTQYALSSGNVEQVYLGVRVFA
jgi:hypothetical protein